MDETQIYALVLGGLFASLVVARLLSWLYQDFLRYKTWLLRLLVYPYLMRRHRLAGPWTRAQVIGYLLYLIANIFSASFRVSSITAAESRTGILSLVNVVPLFFGLHLGFLADLLGISLRTYHWIHSAAASMSMALATTHVILHAVIHGSVSLRARTQLYGVIVCLFLICLLFLLLNATKAATSLLVLFAARIKIVRRPSYELFLRSHQIIAALYAITIWRHVGSRSRSRISLLCIQIIPGVFLSTVLLETAAIIIRNFALRQPYARALIYKKGKAVSLSLSVPRPWNIRAGQYINLWIPGVSFRSFVTLQSHPFTIASWTSGKAMSLDFLIEPRAGFTKLLAQVAERSERPYIAFFSGPHGTPVPVGSFGSVMMVASGFGIAAQLPYLKELIEGYNRCEVRTRRIHLIWQLREQGTSRLLILVGRRLISIGEETYAEDLVDKALQDDTLDNGYVRNPSKSEIWG